MKIYMARQPIYNSEEVLYGYELLYRNSEENSFCNVDEDRATRELTYNLLSEFDFASITNQKYGFINFTRESIMSDIPLLFKPKDIIIEILENVEVDEELIEKIKYLKENHYILALDDFVDDGTYDDILPYIQIIKTEYGLLDINKRKDIARKYGNNKKILAERIETKEDYKNAIDDGYELFQGYYFSKPIMISKESVNIGKSTYIRLWKEISKEDPSFDNLENIIKLDAGLTYKLLSLMNTPIYYRGDKINSIKQALVRMGINEVKRWVLLLFLRDVCDKGKDEFTKISLIRAMFMEKTIKEMGYGKLINEAYIMGLLSIVDNKLDEGILSILNTLELSKNFEKALIHKEGILYELLQCIKEYENSNWDKVEEFAKKYDLNGYVLSSMYFKSVKYADDMFKTN